MTYPNNLQFSNDPSWMYQQLPGMSQPNLNMQAQIPTAINPWQQDLGAAVQNNAYKSLGLDSSGFYQAGVNPQTGGIGNWMANNGNLINAGVGLLTGGFGAFNGMKQNSLLERNLNMQSSQFREQMDLSKQTMNRNLEDRQRARVASNPVAYEPVSEYMKKYGAK